MTIRSHAVMPAADAVALSQKFCSSCGAKLEREVGRRRAPTPTLAVGSTDISALNRPRRRTTRLTFELAHPSPNFVGRDKELQRIISICQGAEPTTSIAISGAAGIGKARLILEAKQQLSRQVPIFFAASDPSGLKTPWYPILTILDEILGLEGPTDLARLSEAVARCGLPARDVPGLAEIFGVDGPAARLELAVRRREAHAAALRALLSIRRRFPRAVLCFADVDDYDRPSQNLIAGLNEAMANTGMRLIVTATDPTLLPETEAHITLMGLPPPSTRELTALLAGADTPMPTALSLHSVTNGCPAAVEQLAGWLLMGNSAAAAPSLLVDLVSLRVNRLPTAARRILQAVAIHGTVAPRWLVEMTLEETAFVGMDEQDWTGLLAFLRRPGDNTIRARCQRRRGVHPGRCPPQPAPACPRGAPRQGAVWRARPSCPWRRRA